MNLQNDCLKLAQVEYSFVLFSFQCSHNITQIGKMSVKLFDFINYDFVAVMCLTDDFESVQKMLHLKKRELNVNSQNEWNE